MSHDHTDDGKRDDRIAAENIERLLQEAYAPEAPADEFVQRMNEELLAAAADRRPSNVITLPSRIAAAAAAILLSVGVIFVGSQPRVVLSTATKATAWQQPKLVEPASFNPLGPTGTKARERAAAPEVQALAEGDTLRTGTRERRLVTLPDGTRLYANADAEVTLEGPRALRLTAGEVYLEVRHDPTWPFVVRTPDREVQALGTRFAVNADAAGTGVLVTQGRVQVDGIDGVLRAGQQVAFGATAPSLAPRASHTLSWTRDLMAAAQSPLVPASDYAGGALIAVDPWGTEARLSLRGYHVDVHIEDGFARTTIDQTYFNHANWRLEGTFYFPLPADASLSRLAMYVAGKLMEGGMAERSRARDVYEQIVTRKKDPALLEWVDGSTFKMRVFPLEPREEKRIVLSYTQRLPSAYGRTSYRFPTGHNLEAVKSWSFHARSVDAAGVRWSCASHQLASSDEDGDLLLDAAAENVKLDDDVVLQFEDQPLPEHGARFATALHEGARYLSVRYRPELPTEPAATRRDWVFLVETSGNRDPLLARVQLDVMRGLLESAEQGDTFAVVTIGTDAYTLSDTRVPAVPENVEPALDLLEQAHLVGALDLARGLEATRNLLDGAENPVLVHLGSGVSTLGERDPTALAESLDADVPYIGVAVGKRWSRPFMKQAAARTGGLFTQVNPDEPTNWRAFELLSTLNTPRLLDVAVVDDAEKAAFLTFEDAIAHGEDVVAIVRLTPGAALPTAVTITGTVGGETYRYSLPVTDPRPDAMALPRMWGKLEIDRLLALGGDGNRDAIVNLSKQLYVMSPYTSLLVLENEEMYRRFKVDRGRKDHWALYPCPAEIEVVREPLPDGWTARVAGEAGEVKTERQILATLLHRARRRQLMSPYAQYGHHGGVAINLGAVPSGGIWFRDELFEEGAGEFFNNSSDGDFRARTENIFDLALIRGGLGGGVPRGGNGAFSGPRTGGAPPPGGGPPVAREFAKNQITDLFGWRESNARSNGLGWWGNGRFDLEAESLDLLTVAGGTAMDGDYRLIAGLRTYTYSSDFDVEFGDREVAHKLMRSIDGDGRVGPMAGLRMDFEFAARTWSDQRPPAYEQVSQRRAQRLNYQRPYPQNDLWYFADLLAFAPGMNTTRDDVAGVISDEGPARPRGRIDDAALALIDGARSRGWTKVGVTARTRANGFRIFHDGAGRFTYRRMLPNGLMEQVVFDGETLLHLYPQIGVGARRKATRFHRAALSRLIPWALSSAEDLAHGADVVSSGERTVDIVPHGGGTRRVRLVFAEDGRLAERRIVDGDDVLATIVYGADGTVSVQDEEGKEIHRREYVVTGASEPRLQPDVSALVVLPLPYRTRDQVFAAHGGNTDVAKWTDDEIVELLAADLCQYPHQMVKQIYARFLHQGDQRLGFYTLIAASNYTWPPGQERDFGEGVRARFEPTKTAPNDPLAHFLETQVRRLHDQKFEGEAKEAGLAVPFLEQLDGHARLIRKWTSGRGWQGSTAERRAAVREVLDLVERTEDRVRAFALLATLWNQGAPNHADDHARIGRLLTRIAEEPSLEYYARYERARSLYSSNHANAARKEFVALYDDVWKHGGLPPIDWAFVRALDQGTTERSEQFPAFVAQRGRELIEQGRRGQAQFLALQAYTHGQQDVANEIHLAATTGVPEDARRDAAFGAFEFLRQSGRHALAARSLDGLLAADPEDAGVWRLVSLAAQQSGSESRALHALERALEIEYAELPDLVNVQTVRSDHADLLQRLARIADASRALEQPAPQGFLARVIHAADRWRALDIDPTPACQAAARVFRSLGEDGLAWAYLTTPLGDKPNESAPWVALAGQLEQEAALGLAARAYETGFAIEPTNADILFALARTLQQAGRQSEAAAVYESIVSGDWQPRFDGTKEQAKRALRR